MLKSIVVELTTEEPYSKSFKLTVERFDIMCNAVGFEKYYQKQRKYY